MNDIDKENDFWIAFIDQFMLNNEFGTIDKILLNLHYMEYDHMTNDMILSILTMTGQAKDKLKYRYLLERHAQTCISEENLVGLLS